MMLSLPVGSMTSSVIEAGIFLGSNRFDNFSLADFICFQIVEYQTISKAIQVSIKFLGKGMRANRKFFRSNSKNIKSVIFFVLKVTDDCGLSVQFRLEDSQ